MSVLPAEAKLRGKKANGGQVLIGRSLAPGFPLRTLRTFLSAVKTFPYEGKYISQNTGKRSDKAGFTLVEIIVVIVIIAILAAIGVPALTGYIDKAQDRKYIAEARDAMIATRSVMNELYADGVRFNINGDVTNGSQERTGGLRYWSFNEIPKYAGLSSDTIDDIIARRISALAGRDYRGDAFFSSGVDNDIDKGIIFKNIVLLGSPGSDIYTADGFYYGQATSNGTKDLFEDLIVTYKVDRINIEGLKYEDGEEVTNIGLYEVLLFGEYNPNAGYEIYYRNNEE